MKLWFEDVNRQERLIANCETWEDVDKTIDNFIQSCNNSKIEAAIEIYDDFDLSKVKLFHRYYTRCWKQEDDRTRIDVGSHSEFFIWEGQYEPEST